MPTKYKPIPEDEQKIDYGTAKSHYANVRFKQGLPKIVGGDIKKGTQAYNEIVLLQKGLKEKDFVLLLAELADRSPEHWQMMAKYYEKRGWSFKIAGEVFADAKAFYGESNKGPLDSISNLAIAGGGGGPIQEAPKPLPPPLVIAPKVNKGYASGFLNILPRIDPYIEQNISWKQAVNEQQERNRKQAERDGQLQNPEKLSVPAALQQLREISTENKKIYHLAEGKHYQNNINAFVDNNGLVYVGKHADWGYMDLNAYDIEKNIVQTPVGYVSPNEFRLVLVDRGMIQPMMIHPMTGETNFMDGDYIVEDLTRWWLKHNKKGKKKSK
jgi:hypothetical protein